MAIRIGCRPSPPLLPASPALTLFPAPSASSAPSTRLSPRMGGADRHESERPHDRYRSGRVAGPPARDDRAARKDRSRPHRPLGYQTKDGSGCCRQSPTFTAPTVSNGDGCRRSWHASEKPRVRSDQDVLRETGIRTLRRKPVFHTPNVFPTQSVADGFVAHDVHDSREADDESRIPNHEPRIPDPESPIPSPESHERQHCYVCKQKYTTLHDFYDQLCPSCAALNVTKRTERADLRGRVALLTGGRVVGYQAGLGSFDRAPASSSRPAFPGTERCATRRNPTLPSGETDSRSSVSTCVIRRASRRSAASCSIRATVWTSSSTTPARPCAGHLTSTRT